MPSRYSGLSISGRNRATVLHTSGARDGEHAARTSTSPHFIAKETTTITTNQHRRSWGTLLLSISIGVFAAFLIGATPAISQPPPSGDWVVTGPETVENQMITLDGNLVVSTTGSLALTNVTLIPSPTTRSA